MRLWLLDCSHVDVVFECLNMPITITVPYRHDLFQTKKQDCKSDPYNSGKFKIESFIKVGIIRE